MSDKERASRISYQVSVDESCSDFGWESQEHLYASLLRAVVKDFPPFRTAEKPNEWEKGYHTVLETLLDIAFELETLGSEKNKIRKKYFEISSNTGKVCNNKLELLDLKAKISRLLEPNNPNYTDEEIEAMTEENNMEAEKTKRVWENLVDPADVPDVKKITTNEPCLAWNGFIPGSTEALANGCKCPVLDNMEMPDDKKWIDLSCPLHGRRSVA